ncbi:DUF3857 domain-containing protein [Dokdonia sinensis]|uniref:DUF3857 domain-containing protein n=1 Tax=Dokdonia sinensis TaxID=2479847 RepID=A0A3M0FVT5_9FLAO|nr:DUF3857 domain-containing protein [Dokdonia sinensis]RMB56615.1 DUF3857 domain-containing protein [Dokdonia sinensis]
MRFLIFLMTLTLLQSVAGQNYSFRNISSELIENSNSVVRLDSTVVTILNQETLEIHRKRIVTVLNHKGDIDIDAYVHYDKETKVKDIEALVFNSSGKEIEKLKKRDFNDVSAISNGTLFSDSRVLFMNYTPISYPYTVVFSSTTRSENTAFIPSWEPTRRFNSSTERSVYTVYHNGDLGLKYKVLNDTDSILISEEPYKLTISTENYSSITPEAYGPSFDKIVPQIMFGLDEFYLAGVSGIGTDWESFGRWMDVNLLENTRDLPENTKQQIINLVSGIDDKVERARKIYQYVQDKTRYISVQVGIGGWKPMLASEVDKLGYGDCKALTNYTKALLEVADISSYYTILYAGQEKKDIQEDFVSMQGNHVILSIPIEDRYIWLECTSQDLPFGFLGDFTDDREVLQITQDGGQLAHTDIYQTKNNGQQIDGSYRIRDDGSIEASVRLISSGVQYDNKYFVASKTDEEKKEFYYNHWDYINNMSLHDIDFVNDRNAVVLTEKVNFTAERYVSFAGEEMLVPLNAFNRMTTIPKKYKERKFDFQIDRGFEDADRVSIAFPVDYFLDELPEDVEIVTDFGSYNLSYTRVEEGINYFRKLVVNDGLYPKEKYEDFRNFLKRVARQDKQKMILRKKK